MTGMTAKYELENCYDIKLDTVDKLLALKTMMEDVDNELIRNTSRRYRIPLLAIRQTLDECFEILKSYHAVEVTDYESSITN